MKKLIIYIIGIFFFLASCERVPEVESPHFAVSSNKEIYELGDSVHFYFEGEPDIITFYSGELGSDYTYKDGRIASPDYFLNFETQSRDGKQVNQLRVLASTDFTEDYTIEGVHKATWIDITDKFVMAPPNNGAPFVSSGRESISELIDPNADETNIYFAVRQDVKNQLINGMGGLNRLRYFTITSTYSTLSSTLREHPEMGWILFSTPNKQEGRAALENINTIMMRNSWPESYLPEDTEDWAVSNMVTIPANLDMGPDKPLSLKGVNDIKLDKFTHIYKEPGEYKVLFRAINANKNSLKDVMKEMTIIVTN